MANSVVQSPMGSHHLEPVDPHEDSHYVVTSTPHNKDTMPMLSPVPPVNEPADADAKPAEDDNKVRVGPTVNKILFLDGLRGLAAMMVVVQHSHWIGECRVGEPAVDTFFVLSAFLLTMIFEKKARTLIKEKASPRRWGWALLDYFVRRFLRVYPLFFVTALVIQFLSDSDRERFFVFSHPENYNLFKVLIFSFKYRYHVFWTLPLEIMYYFMIPPLVVFILVLRKFWLIPLLPLGYWIVWSGFTWNRSNHQPLRLHLPTFVCGSIAAIVYCKAEQYMQKSKLVVRWWHWTTVRSIEMFFLGIFFSVMFNGLFFDWIYHNPVPQTPGEKFVTVNVSIVIVCEMLIPGAVSSILEWSLLRYAGKISYSMYLLHSFVVYSAWVSKQNYWNRFWAIWGLCFLLSTASYHVIEYPCQWLAGRIGKAIKKRDELEKKKQQAATLPLINETPAHLDA